jgi:hypothetical protein
VLELSTDDPVSYAMQWNGGPGKASSAAAVAAEPWAADYRARGIEAISTGALVLRKHSGPNWMRVDRLATVVRGDTRPHLERVFAVQDLLQSLDGERGLLSLALVQAPGVVLVERRLPGGELERGRLTVEEGIPLSGRVPVEVAPVLAALDGRRTLADVIAALAGEALTAAAVPAIGELVARGLLVAQPSG